MSGRIRVLPEDEVCKARSQLYTFEVNGQSLPHAGANDFHYLNIS